VNPGPPAIAALRQASVSGNTSRQVSKWSRELHAWTNAFRQVNTTPEFRPCRPRAISCLSACWAHLACTTTPRRGCRPVSPTQKAGIFLGLKTLGRGVLGVRPARAIEFVDIATLRWGLCRSDWGWSGLVCCMRKRGAERPTLLRSRAAALNRGILASADSRREHTPFAPRSGCDSASTLAARSPPSPSPGYASRDLDKCALPFYRTNTFFTLCDDIKTHSANPCCARARHEFEWTGALGCFCCRSKPYQTKYGGGGISLACTAAAYAGRVQACMLGPTCWCRSAISNELVLSACQGLRYAGAKLTSAA